MKKFLMGTAALAVCVGLTACSPADGGAADITGIQSLTASEVTRQTVLQPAAVGTDKAAEMKPHFKNESTFEISEDTDILISVKNANSDSLELKICNKTPSTIFWGQWYVIEKQENNAWYQLQEIELEENVVFGWEDILYSLKAENTTVENENWIDYYGSLPKGDYRIVKAFFFDERQQDEKIYVACEFSITDDDPSEKVTTGLCKYPLLEDMYDPCGEVTLPDVIDGCYHSSTVKHMFYSELPIYEYGGYEAGESDYDECNECYKRLLAEHIINHCDRAELFGGAYFCDGWLQVRVTDYGSRDEVLGDFLDGLESVNVGSCDYSYCYLAEVQGAVQQAQVGTPEENIQQAGTSEINVQNNRVDVTVSSELEAEIVREAVENAELDLDAVHIEIENEWEIVSEPRYTEP